MMVAMSQTLTPPGRYGQAPSAGRRRLIVAGIVALGVVAIAFAAWVGWSTGSVDVHYRDVGFQVHGPDETDITFEVTMTPGTSATCIVQALDETYAQVGVKTVEITASGKNTQTVTASIATQHEATTAIVMSCDPVSTP